MKKKLIKQIDQHDVISFDIFDTLLFRNIYKPTDIFKIVGLKYEKINNFERIRIEAERKARQKVESNEIKIDDIYEVIRKELNISKDECNNIIKIELETEKEFIEINPFMKDIFEYCLKKKKKVMLISDMYLDSCLIKELFKNNNYDINCPIYMSCEHDANKGSGKLFQIVKEKEKISYDQWLHIGDNEYSDVSIPQSLGIDAFHYKNINSYEDTKYNSIFESIVLAIRNNYTYNGSEENYWKLLGVKNFATIYLGFTNWIYQMTYDFDNLYFIARDGYIIKKIYDLFPKSNDKYIDYLYCSRKSLQIPSMILGSTDYMINFLTPIVNDKTTLGKLFRNCQLEPEEKYEKIIRLYGFKSFDDIVLPEDRHRAIKCICYFIDDITTKLKKELKIANDYLQQEGMSKFETINVVDIGWGGSIQESIQRILNKRIRGFYLGTINAEKKDYLTNSFGYLFDQGEPEEMKERIHSQVMMYELFFSAPHGSTLGYKRTKNKIVPILKESDDNTDIISLLQESSIEVIKKILKYYKYYDSLDIEFCIHFYDEFLNKHDYNDVKEFSNYSNDYLLGDDSSFPYVQTFKKKYVENYYYQFKEKIKDSLWSGAYIIEDCKSEKEQNNFIARMEQITKISSFGVNTKSLRNLFRQIVPLKLRKSLKNFISK